MIFETSVEGLVKSINDRLEHILRAEIERQMEMRAKELIHDAAVDLARNLRGLVISQRDHRADEIRLMVKIDGVTEEVSPKE